MKLERLLRVSIGLLGAIRWASAQGVVSQLGGFLEQVHDVPVQAADAGPSLTDPLTLFLQQEPPTFPVASPELEVAAQAESVPVEDVLSKLTVAAAPAPAAMSKPKGLLKVRSMRVANKGVEGSKIFFGTGSEWSMGTDAAGNFQIQQSSAASPLVSLDSGNKLSLGSKRVEVLSLDAAQGVSVRGVKQWQLVYSDDFSAGGSGWSRLDTTQCGGVFMLGGYCKFGKGEVNKTFYGLPAHKQLKVVATYHFIDRWIGETGYMKLDVGGSDCQVVPVWSEQHAQEITKNGLNLCGNVNTPEGKFSTPVEVTLPHSKASVDVTFGATMQSADPCDESWGVSAVEVYVRG